ncbi:hypothetical protein R9C00_10590 [Flammeovirgaceae bacterium SG7u.111]|nr:hypothetical protein [Flammeovirgaceae bacterium SG7u.132]WPO37900.1 hypothetical protein R9C00_10590 [Flammeovirgaceae bacterium SG7u.111]
MNYLKNAFKFLIIGMFITNGIKAQTPIDRKAVVSRHNVVLNEVDTLNSLTLGNGSFAMTMDATGLQTFPIEYSKGMSLGTLSEWGWHSFPTEETYKIEETLVPLKSHGREVPYARQWKEKDKRQWEAGNYLRQNPHRIHLATVGWYILKKDGSKITISDVKKIEQKLDLWKGELTSTFEVEGEPVEVITLVGQTHDMLGVKVKSPLLAKGRLGISINFPYPTDAFADEAVNFDSEEPKRLKLLHNNKKTLSIQRDLDTTTYVTHVASSLQLASAKATEKGFIVLPKTKQSEWEFTCEFVPNTRPQFSSDFEKLQKEIHAAYQQFWQSGGMIDLGETEDKRAAELERMMVLSLYLTKVNCGGSSPPQETGLTYNSWYGKPHMEMIWWHGTHFALWNRPEILEKQLSWYFRSVDVARKISKRQGFKGVRWQKMTDNEGGETVSSVGSYLLWQQPHIIYFAELLYSVKKDSKVLDKYTELIEETAEFMADFAYKDPDKKRYILGPGVIPAQERFDAQTTFNPTYELAYWRWGLETAQMWRERKGLERNKTWDKVLDNLSPLPMKDGLYLATESSPDSYTTQRYMTDHPSVLGTFGMLPATKGLDKKVMENTFDKIWKDWQWEDTWGWDFPMTAMTATRLGKPEKAVEALLMPITTNTYLKNGHNYQTDRLRLYLPGNGGVLIALAMMAAGTQDNPQPNLGFPKDWKVKVENISQMP